MIIEFQKVYKSYNKTEVLKDLSFTLNETEVFGILGPNGSGKSTILKLIATILEPTEGRIFIGGYDTKLFRDQSKRFIGYLPENNPLYYHMYPLEFFEFTKEIYKIDNTEYKKRLEKVITDLDLKAVLDKKIKTLSKGYKQRIGLAKILIQNPKIFVLDEPNTGLDPLQVTKFRKLILEQAKEHKKCVILSTHNMKEVEKLCDKTLILSKGQKVGEYSIHQLREKRLPSIYLKTKLKLEETQLELFKNLEEIKNIEIKDNVLLISLNHKVVGSETKKIDNILSQLFNIVKENNIPLLELKLIESNINTIIEKMLN